MLTAVPAVAAADCQITIGNGQITAATQAEILACINALQADVNANLVTAINAYGNPTCT